MNNYTCTYFGDTVESALGTTDNCPTKHYKCRHMIIDWLNKKIYANSPSGNGICTDSEGHIIRNYRGCAEIEDDIIIINEFDKNYKYKSD